MEDQNLHELGLPEGDGDGRDHPNGIVTKLGEVGEGTLIFESGLAAMLNRHPASIKRAVERGELPPPTRLSGQPVWTAGSIIRHIENRLAEASKEAERQNKRLRALSP